ncbi:hypothetical protein A2Z22_05155 [Candidatus Woesebacteria bacterium RBG_16_34_12]|uniref:Uncharacterized protein n=1 Tax=Candidatus Woesebacteria bacterium RBG_16_34_12 TaxID=1802480 RepID=A0A1F7X8G8_9BACT|nr:MAG: hypothetical protein A2Z22_05155 [Candidatus Woesebacteria bacterium RBG_16_34_12]
MPKKLEITNILNIISLVLPVILILLSTFLSPYGYTNLEETWEKLWQFYLMFYIFLFFIYLSIFFRQDKKSFGKIKYRFQFWFIGLFFSFFSQIVAKLVWDFAFFINYLVKVRL